MTKYNSKNEDYIKNSFLNSIFESCVTKQIENFWFDKIVKNKNGFNDNTFGRFMEIYMNQNEFNVYQLSLLMRIMDLENFEEESIKKLLFLLQKNDFVRSLFLEKLYFITLNKKLLHFYLKYPSNFKSETLYSYFRKIYDNYNFSIEIVIILADIMSKINLEKSNKHIINLIYEFISKNDYIHGKLYSEIFAFLNSNYIILN